MCDVAVALKIREGDPICVSSQILTSNSPVFHYLVTELSQTELEFEDFTPYIVFIFLAAFEEGIIADIRDDDFREIHKLCKTFRVQWLVKHCQVWLTVKIDDMDPDTGYEERLFVFEECRYILNKWRENHFMNQFISKYLSLEETELISQFMKDLEKVNHQQIDLMLKLGGSNGEVFLEIIIKSIEGKQSLGENTKYLLQRLNLPLCFEQNESLYHEMFEKCSLLPQLQMEDQKLLLQISLDTGKQVYRRKLPYSGTKTVFNLMSWRSILDRCHTLDDIVKLAEEGWDINMFSLTELLMIVASTGEISTETSKDFVKKMESSATSLTKVLPDYINMIITAVKSSDKSEKFRVMELLDMIKDSEILASQFETVCIFTEESEKMVDLESRWSSCRYPFQFQHPAVRNCEMEGKCGFIIKDYTDDEKGYTLQLTEGSADYEGTGLHFHPELRADDLFLYVMCSINIENGSRVRVPARWRRWWFPDVSEGKIEQYCVAVSVKDYLAAACRDGT